MGEYIKKFLSVLEAVSYPKKLHTPNVSYVIGSTNPGEVVFVSGNTGNPFVFREDAGFVYPAYPYPVHYIFWTNDSQNGLWDDRNNWTDEYGNHLTDLAELQDDLVVNISPYRSKKSANGVDFPTFDGFPEVVKINDTKIASTIYIANGATIQSSLLYDYPECYDRIVFEDGYYMDENHDYIVAPLLLTEEGGNNWTVGFMAKNQEPQVFCCPILDITNTGVTYNTELRDETAPFITGVPAYGFRFPNRFSSWGYPSSTMGNSWSPVDLEYLNSKVLVTFTGKLSSDIYIAKTLTLGQYYIMQNTSLLYLDIEKFLYKYNGNLYSSATTHPRVDNVGYLTPLSTGYISPGLCFIYAPNMTLEVIIDDDILVSTNFFQQKQHQTSSGEAPYLGMGALEDSTILFIYHDASLTLLYDYVKLEYSLDYGQHWLYYVPRTVLNIPQGQHIWWRGDNEFMCNANLGNYHLFITTGSLQAYGSVLALLHPHQTTMDYDYCLEMLFDGCAAISGTVTLPSDVTRGCFLRLFYGSNIVSNSLFANTVKPYCYYSMYLNNTAITEVFLPASEGAVNCYRRMFSGASALSSITCYLSEPDGSSTTGFTNSWINKVATSGVFKGVNINKWRLITNKNNGIPANWEVQDIDYLTLTAVEDSTVQLGYSSVAYDFEYRTNIRSDWSAYNAEIISLSSGEYVLFRGNNPNGLYGQQRFKLTGKLEGSGSCLSLLSKDNSITVVPANGFDSLFAGQVSLVLPPKIPATEVKLSGCFGMFQISGITAAPELPATIVGNSAYSQMFREAESLVTAPTVLPALSLSDYCYGSMFFGCLSLLKAPYLPAETLDNYCYDQMFLYCDNLEKKLSYTSDFPLLTDNDFLNYFIGWEMWIDGEFAGIIGTNYPGNYYY